ncbi:hypothetical protein BUALT_Bualt02G0224500 [Buddleja alternifolia]|uniref:C2H2-type domain-containing protein n=1 Tax=Buddleja alternifolia TaxID=168488 RepID=A0AAV6YD26_9LAMI|nr:hypothetical protein BUALT_Bualt02G0224500 [Buddleja alternifolia]
MENPGFEIIVLKVGNICCPAYQKRLKKELSKLDGVYSITINPEKSIVSVTGKVDANLLVKIITAKTDYVPPNVDDRICRDYYCRIHMRRIIIRDSVLPGESSWHFGHFPHHTSRPIHVSDQYGPRWLWRSRRLLQMVGFVQVDLCLDLVAMVLLVMSMHKCAACFKQYKKKEHLIAHMKTSYHSAHQPKCGVCQKHCKSFESLREHATGSLSKGNCSKIFAERGCKLCMRIFDSPFILNEHQQICFQPAPAHLGIMRLPCTESQIYDPPVTTENGEGSHPEAIAIDCAMVGGGSDESLDLCARVCLVDEDEKVIFHTYVIPQIPVTNYRYEVTGITEDHLREAMPLKEVQDKIRQILYNGESIGRLRLHGGKARLLLGHGLDHDLDCLKMNYPDHLLR